MRPSLPAWRHPTHRQIGTALRLSGCTKFLGAAVANSYKLGGLKQQKFILTVLGDGSLKSRCQQSWFLLRAPRENLLHISLLASDANDQHPLLLPGNLQMHHSHLCLHHHTVFSLCFLVSKFPSS